MKTKDSIYPLIIIGILFFVFGFLTWINGILIPYLQICLDLSNFQATLVVFASYSAYFVMAIPSAKILEKTGYKKGMVIGLLVMALGTLLFIPAAYTRTYALFLIGLFITGTGLTLLQTAANPYLAVIGPVESTAQRVGFMGISNKIAGLIGIGILGSIFLLSADSILVELKTLSLTEKAIVLDKYALKVVWPYLLITLFLILLSVWISKTNLPEINEQEDVKVNLETKSNITHYPHLILGILTLFCSSAVEAIPIDGIVLYSRTLNIPLAVSRHYTSYTLIAMLVGYIASSILIPKYLSQQKALMLCALWGIVLTIGSYLLPGIYSLYCLILMGVGGAMLWGTIWGLALRDLGKYTKLAGGMMLMAVVGGGIFPVIYGKLLDLNPNSPQNAVLLLIPCNLILLYYAVSGHKLNFWSKN